MLTQSLPYSHKLLCTFLPPYILISYIHANTFTHTWHNLIMHPPIHPRICMWTHLHLHQHILLPSRGSTHSVPTRFSKANTLQKCKTNFTFPFVLPLSSQAGGVLLWTSLVPLFAVMGCSSAVKKTLTCLPSRPPTSAVPAGPNYKIPKLDVSFTNRALSVSFFDHCSWKQLHYELQC